MGQSPGTEHPKSPKWLSIWFWPTSPYWYLPVVFKLPWPTKEKQPWLAGQAENTFWSEAVYAGAQSKESLRKHPEVSIKTSIHSRCRSWTWVEPLFWQEMHTPDGAVHTFLGIRTEQKWGLDGPDQGAGPLVPWLVLRTAERPGSFCWELLRIFSVPGCLGHAFWSWCLVLLRKRRWKLPSKKC